MDRSGALCALPSPARTPGSSLCESCSPTGTEITDPASADMVISPPWDPSARYARRGGVSDRDRPAHRRGRDRALPPGNRAFRRAHTAAGYGRIARLLARGKRPAFSRHLPRRAPVAARMGGGGGHQALPLDALSGALDRFDVIIGTIPAPVLTSRCARPEGRAAAGVLPPRPAGSMPPRRTEGSSLHPRAGPAGEYAARRAAVILRDAVYAAAAEPLPRLGLAVTGSHCTFSRALEAFRPLKLGYAVPILSAARRRGTDTRFFAASAFRAGAEAFCGREAVDTIVKAEPLRHRAASTRLVAPCTGALHTLAKARPRRHGYRRH